MKLQKISTYFKQLLLFSAIAAPIVLAERSCRNAEIEKARTQILAVDSVRGKQIIEESEKMDAANRPHYLNRALKEMKDSAESVKMSEGQIPRAYFEGVQAVRDSLAASGEK